MHKQHWGMNESPFGAVDENLFYASPTHQEALARLQYLVENGRRLGLLLGEVGSGKSLLLRVFTRQLRQQMQQVAYLNLLGIDEDQFLLGLAEQLGGRVQASDPRFVVWRKINDRLTENRYQQLQTVLLLDEAGEATPGVLQQVLRLLQIVSAGDVRLSVVVAASAKNVGRLGHRLLDLAELRVEVESWSSEETANFISGSLEKVGASDGLFDKTATERLHQLTQGIPRRVSQLAELALLAGAGQGMSHVDDQTVETVYRELSVTSSDR